MNDRVPVTGNCIDSGPQLSGRNFIVITSFLRHLKDLLEDPQILSDWLSHKHIPKHVYTTYSHKLIPTPSHKHIPKHWTAWRKKLKLASCEFQLFSFNFLRQAVQKGNFSISECLYSVFLMHLLLPYRRATI